MKALAIIPARYASTRLPAKPLADIHGKPMIQWVWEQVIKAIPEAVVATDDPRIAQVVEGFGGQVVLTRADHPTGTNRCLEAFQKWSQKTGKEFDIVVNVQGDEPMLEPDQLHELLSCFDEPHTEMGTLAMEVSRVEDLMNESEAFVVMTNRRDALYFSRSPLPHVRGVAKQNWLTHHTYYKHVGLYAYTPKSLETFAQLPVSPLERAESLEQNRWLENGGKIRVAFTRFDSIPVDTPEDLERVRTMLHP